MHSNDNSRNTSRKELHLIQSKQCTPKLTKQSVLTLLTKGLVKNNSREKVSSLKDVPSPTCGQQQAEE